MPIDLLLARDVVVRRKDENSRCRGLLGGTGVFNCLLRRLRGCSKEYRKIIIQRSKILSRIFIRLRRRPRLRTETHFGVQARALPVDECVSGIRTASGPKYCCFGGFRHRRITLRSLGACAPKRFSAQGRRRVFHGGTTGFARGTPLEMFCERIFSSFRISFFEKFIDLFNEFQLFFLV